MPAPVPPIALVGGIVAHNEEATIGPAIRSLLDQELGDRAYWRSIWIVASGCTDRTVERVRSEVGFDPRVQLVEQAERRGKADALNTILDRARGDLLVLLNGDAASEPGSVRTLLDAAEGLAAPFAVMGRPVPPSEAPASAVGGAVALLWSIHAELHAETLGNGVGNHLSDELLLVSLPAPVRFSDGTINDGAYLGAAILALGGRLRYASDARVRIRVPTTAADYLAQRRRIYVGHARQARETGTVPTTLVSLALRSPTRAVRLLARAWRKQARRDRLGVLFALEAAAILTAVWDELPPRRSHVLWQRVASSAAWDRGSEPGSSRT